MNKRGFSIIELLVTMALVIVIIMITGSAFESILKSTGRLTSSEESNIEGVIGLEMFRHDLQQMGFGLPTAFQATPPVYTEAGFTPANMLNDAPSGVPRAIASWESLVGASDTTSESGITYNILSDTDYLAIKATSVGRSKASQKWTFLGYSSNGGKKPNTWASAADNLKASDTVVVLNRTFSAAGQVSNTMVYDTATPDIYWPSNPTVIMADSFNPLQPNQVYYLYGVDDGDELGMPFNRADYFVARPSQAGRVPTTCAPGTGILYKKNVSHADGTLIPYPLLDCVADMQVVFGWDVNGNGVIDESGAYESDVSKISVSSTIGTTAATIKAIMESSDDIRNKLKYIKVYIMAQDGRSDPNFTNTNTLVGNTLSIVVSDPGSVSLTKGYTAADLTTKGWLNYRWKIYRIVVRPKNLAAN